MLDTWLAALSDPLFRLPLLAGLVLAALLPVIGALLMLRDEWLAALGLAHVAAASALLGHALGLPTLIGGTAGALAGGALKTRFDARGNVAYAFMILVGWSATLLIGANSELGERLAHALVEGQLYFAGLSELSAVLALSGAALWILPRILPRLLRSRFFPRFEQANALPAWRWHLQMDLLAAASLAGCLRAGPGAGLGDLPDRAELALDPARRGAGRGRRLPHRVRPGPAARPAVRTSIGRRAPRDRGQHAADARISSGRADR